MSESDSPVLEVRNLKKYFTQSTSVVDTLLRRRQSQIQAVDDVSFTLEENESQGVIGESGCGKSTLLKTLIGLHEPTEGEILFKGQDITDLSRTEGREFRSNVQIIFQDPFNSLDPKLKVREALAEPLKIHDMDNHTERIRGVLDRVELQPVDNYIDRSPNQLSGGEKQRVAIARALIVEPDLVLADEPTSMLDVSTQAALLSLLSELLEETGASMLYISHDLSTVSYICQRINVMYLGRIVERNETQQLLDDPQHPYSQALMDAIPIPDPNHKRRRTELGGTPRDPIDLGEGCRFRDRCPEAMDICEKTPEFVEAENGAKTACHLYYDHEEQVNGNAQGPATGPSVDDSSADMASTSED
jgi:peptide/nickel transport system ATP-binding protein